MINQQQKNDKLAIEEDRKYKRKINNRGRLNEKLAIDKDRMRNQQQKNLE